MAQWAEQVQSTPTSKFALLGVLFLGLYYVLFFDDGSRLDRNIKRLKSEISKKRTVAETTEKKLENQKRFQQEVVALSEQFREALEFLPNEINVADLIRRINSQARSSGASIVRIQPRRERGRQPGYEEIFMDVELQGSFAELVSFLANISKIQRIIRMSEFSISNSNPSSPTPRLNLTGVLIGYRFVPGES